MIMFLGECVEYLVDKRIRPEDTVKKMLHIIPREDPNQALRIKRFLMAFGSYFIWMLLVLYCYMQGLFR